MKKEKINFRIWIALFLVLILGVGLGWFISFFNTCSDNCEGINKLCDKSYEEINNQSRFPEDFERIECPEFTNLTFCYTDGKGMLTFTAEPVIEKKDEVISIYYYPNAHYIYYPYANYDKKVKE